MTPDQKEYYDRQLAEIRSGGVEHSAFVVDRVRGMASADLGRVDPPAVGFSNDDDPYYMQYFQNWDEVNALIADLKKAAEEAWGKGKSGV